MTIFLALFRGINVGGTRRLPMADLHAACLRLGWQNPQTYIQSGNLIVEAPLPEADARAMLTAHLHAALGWMPEIVFRQPAAWRAHVLANPFSAEPDIDPRALHLYLSAHPPAAEAACVLQARAAAGERVLLAGGALWIDYATSGIARSRLTPASIDRACGAPATGRNWNTVRQLSAMLDARNV